MRWIAGILFLISLDAWADSYAAYPFGDFHWKSPAASVATLPASGNSVGDARIETTTFTANVWNGSAWVGIGGSVSYPISTAHGGTNHGDFTASKNAIVFANDAGTTLTEDPTKLAWDPTKKMLLVGDTSASLRNSAGTNVYLTKTISDLSGISLINVMNSTTTTNGNYNTIAYVSGVNPFVPAGLSNSGEIVGLSAEMSRSDENDLGSLGTMVGIDSVYGSTTEDNTTLTSNMIGIRLAPGSDSGRVTNMYDIFVDPGFLSGTVVTNRYGIYISPDDTGVRKINYLTGTLEIGGSYSVPGANASLTVKDGHTVSTQTTAPVAVVDAHAGTGATCSVSSATDTKMHIALTTTATSPSSGAQCSIAFNKSYGSAPVVAGFVPTNSNAATLSVSSGVYVTTDTGHVVINFAVTDAIGHAYTWDASLME